MGNVYPCKQPRRQSHVWMVCKKEDIYNLYHNLYYSENIPYLIRKKDKFDQILINMECIKLDNNHYAKYINKRIKLSKVISLS
jgi:hypothetical protein